jgi:branched-chain amino acid transport system substrate-binding protein
VRLKSTIWALALLGATGSCASRPAVPAIAYVNADSSIGTVAEQSARAGGTSIDAVLLEASRAEMLEGPGDARDVALAESALTVPAVVAVVGHASSRGALLAAPIYGDARVPFIAPTATSRRLRAAGPWTFQLTPDDEAEGAFIAHFALDSLGARQVAIFYLVADEYGIGLRDGIADALRSRGVEPAAELGILEDSDFKRRTAASLRHRTPDAVVIAARTAQAASIARAVRERLPRVPLILADAVDNGAFVRALGHQIGPVDAVAWWRVDSADSVSRAFVAAFERTAGRPPSQQEAMYYDALMVAAQAVTAVGPRRAAIRRYLRELGVSRPPYRGVTGPISFARNRSTNLVMLRLSQAQASPAPPSGPPR